MNKTYPSLQLYLFMNKPNNQKKPLKTNNQWYPLFTIKAACKLENGMLLCRPLGLTYNEQLQAYTISVEKLQKAPSSFQYEILRIAVKDLLEHA